MASRVGLVVVCLAMVAGCGDDGGDPGSDAAGSDAGAADGPAADAAVANKALIASGNFSCAYLFDGGRLRCWGAGEDNRLGFGAPFDNIGDNELPSSVGDVDIGGTLLDYDGGGGHACALRSDGVVKCWGTNLNGQTGIPGTFYVTSTPAMAPDVDVAGNVTELSVGGNHSCALYDDHAIRCWGEGFYSQLGVADTLDIGFDPARTIRNMGDIVLPGGALQVEAGLEHTCALMIGGSVRCWGTGPQIGLPGMSPVGDDETPSDVPAVAIGGTAVRIAVGGNVSCALLDTGDVRCWGSRAIGVPFAGIVGDDETPDTVGPIDLGGRAVRIAVGREHACALLDTGGVRCWGQNTSGQLGYGHTNPVGDDETPASVGDVELGERALGVTAGGNVFGGHTCALLESGAVKCWGENGLGQLGLGHTDDVGDNEKPSEVEAVQVVAP